MWGEGLREAGLREGECEDSKGVKINPRLQGLSGCRTLLFFFFVLFSDDLLTLLWTILMHFLSTNTALRFWFGLALHGAPTWSYEGNLQVSDSAAISIVHPFHLFSLGSHCQGHGKIAKPEAKHPVSIPTQSSSLLWVSVLMSRITRKGYGNPKVTAINHTRPNAILISESGLPFVSCPANIPNCWPFVHKGECEVHALESPSNTRGIICSYGQAGTTQLYLLIPRPEN